MLEDFVAKMELALGIVERKGYVGKWPEDYSAILFSDSIVMSTPLEGNNFWGLLNQIAYLQGMLSLQSIFLRSAVTIGDHYQAPQIIVSPALIRAYELENTIAIYPRVILDPEICSGKWQLHDEQAEMFFGVDHYLRGLGRDRDGVYFVDYLRSQVDSADCDDGGSDYIRYHKEALMANISEYGHNHRVLAKMVWLANRHNKLILKRIKRYPNTIPRYQYERDQLIDVDAIMGKIE